MARTRQAKGKAKKLRVLIVDDHPIVRHGLRQLISQEPDLEVSGEAERPSEALKAIASLKPHVAIVDLSLREGSGLELIKDIKVRHPKLAVLVLSMHDESIYGERVLRAGARGYITKAEASENLLTAIRRVLAGEIYLSEKMAARMLHKLAAGPGVTDSSPVGVLSDRELEVFQLIGQGLRTRQIAERLQLSVKTIETYRENIKWKLKLEDAAELLQHAIRWAQGENI